MKYRVIVQRVAAVVAVVLCLPSQGNGQRLRAAANPPSAARNLLAQAEESRTQQNALLERSVLLAAEAVRRSKSIEATQALRESLLAMPRSGAVVRLTEGPGLVVTFGPGGRLAAAVRDGVGAQIWDIASSREIEKIPGAQAVVFSGDGRFIGCLMAEGSVDVRRVESEKKTVHSLALEGPYTTLALSPDGRLVAAVDGDGATHVIDVLSGDEMSVIKSQRVPDSVEFSPAGRYLAIDSAGIRMWDLQTRKQVFALDSKAEPTPFSFSPDGRYLAMAIDDKAEVIETSTGHAVAECKHEGSVSAVAFNRSGTMLGTGGSDKLVRLWAWPGGRPLMRLNHSAAVTRISFSGGDRYVATASDDNSATVWQLASGRALQRVSQGKEDNDGEIGVPVFSPDAKYLVFANGKSFSAWLWKPEDLVADACSSLTRNLTPKEWKSYLRSERYEKTCPDLP